MFDLFLILTPLLLLLIVALLRFIGCNQILGNHVLTAANAVTVQIVPGSASLGPGQNKQFSTLVNDMPPDDPGSVSWSPHKFFPTSTNGMFVAPYPWTMNSVTIMASYSGEQGMSSTPGTRIVNLSHANVDIKPSGTIAANPGIPVPFTASATNLTPPSGGPKFTWKVNNKPAPGSTEAASYNYPTPAEYVLGPPATVSFTIDGDPKPNGPDSAMVTLIGNGATLLNADTDKKTQGQWRTKPYGTKGYILADTPNIISKEPYGPPPPLKSLPALPNVVAYTGAAASVPQTLVNPQNPALPGIAALWYSEPVPGYFQIDLQFTDYLVHQLALYFAEWPAGGRTQTVQILDGDNPLIVLSPATTVSDTGTPDFANGLYLVWQVAGHIILRVTNDAAAGSPNGVASALFFD